MNFGQSSSTRRNYLVPLCTDGETFFINPFGDSDDEKMAIDEDELNDGETAKNWRQMRHEREMFLSKQEVPYEKSC